MLVDPFILALRFDYDCRTAVIGNTFAALTTEYLLAAADNNVSSKLYFVPLVPGLAGITLFNIHTSFHFPKGEMPDARLKT